LLEMVAAGQSMARVLEAICDLVESTTTGCHCSVVLIDPSGTRLEHGAAPTLPKSLELLFDAFHTTKSGGMGIGLFVSRSIIERHDGRLWGEPNHGAPGATFSFSIPGGAEHDRDTVSASHSVSRTEAHRQLPQAEPLR
jgi:hypothetical protein